MNRYFVISIFIFLLTNSFGAMAAGWVSRNATIEWINVESDFVRIKFEAADAADPDECGILNEIILFDETIKGERQYSALIAAHMAGKPLRLYVSGCIDRSNKSYPRLWAVYLLK